jgi:hypothetical protein
MAVLKYAPHVTTHKNRIPNNGAIVIGTPKMVGVKQKIGGIKGTIYGQIYHLIRSV